MAGQWELVGGCEATCSDGPVGSLRRLIIDPRAHVVTHLAVEAGGLRPTARLVPIDRVQSAVDEIRLSCSKDEYYSLPVEAHIKLTPGLARRTPTLRADVVHLVPDGKVALKTDADVMTSDGRVGEFVGLTVNSDNHLPEHVHVRVGHFRSKRQLSIPFEYVTYFDKDGRILLNVPKAQLSGFQS
jgi:hypothetical protein